MAETIVKNIISRTLRRARALNVVPRIIHATRYYNKRYLSILKWGLSSREDTNYTYDLSAGNVQYLASTIAVVTKTPLRMILNYIEEARNDNELRNHVINKVRKSDFRGVADARCDFGRRLGWYAFARVLKPRVIVETGVDKGLGAVLLCSALLRNKIEGYEGRYYGTDLNPNAGYLLDGKYREVGEMLYGDSIESLEKLDKKVDLFINDSEHSPDYEYREYVAIRNKLTRNAIILGDNAHVTEKLFLFSVENSRSFLFFHEVPRDHWYPGAGIGISF